MSHLRMPLALGPGRALATLAQDSPEEIAQSAALLLATRVGERRSVPEYGSRDQLGAPLGTTGVDEYALARWEPRATSDVVTITVEGR